MATQQYFSLDSTDPDYAAAIAKLATDTSTNRGYTVTQVVRSASHDANIKIVCAYVDESDLTGDTANLHSDNYPNALCRHRFPNLECLRVWGFHMLGESIRSSEGVASRPMVHVTLEGGGAEDGSTLHDSIPWTDLTAFAAGSTYTFHNLMYRQIAIAQVNGPSTVNCETGGAATDAASINFRWDDELTPAVWVEGQSFHTSSRLVDFLPYEHVPDLVGDGCYINGTFFNPSQNNTVANDPRMLYDSAQADPFKNATDLEADVLIEKKASLSEVAAATHTFYRPIGANKFASPYGTADGVYVDDGGSVSNFTTGDMFPASPAVGDAFVVQHDELFNIVSPDVSVAGAGTYLLEGDILTSSGWVAIANATWCCDAGDPINFKSTNGVGALDPMYVFNPPNAWTAESFNGSPARYTMRLRYASGTMTTVPEATAVNVGASFVVVHLKDGNDPNDGVIVPDSGGLNIGFRLTTAVGQVQFINMNMIGCVQFTAQFLGSGRSSAIVRQKGGRLISGPGAGGEGDTLYQNGAHDEWHLGACTDRTPPWDTSDRPNKDDTFAIQRIIEKWGTDPDEFTAAAVAKFLHFQRFTVGPHYSNAVSGGTAGGYPNYWPQDGVFLDKTGEDFRGVLRSENPDKHSEAIRGSFDPTTPSTHRRVLSRDGHAHLYIYTTADVTNASPISGNNAIVKLTIQDSAFFGVGSHLDNAAGIFGLRFGGGPGSSTLRDNGQGLREITIQRVAVSGIVTPADSDLGEAFGWAWDQAPTIDGLSVIGCTRGVGSGGGESATVLYVVTEDNGTNFTDQTANNYGSVTYNAFPATPAVNDAIYFGLKRWPFRTAVPNIVTPGVGSGLTGVWEYATAEDTWTAIPTSGTFSDGTSSFTAAAGDRTLEFDRPADAVLTDKNGDLIYEVYWIRFRITAGTYTTVPQITSVNGPTGGSLFVSTAADKMEFLDMEGPWLGVKGSNSDYDSDGRTFIVDRVTGRLKSGETIATFEMFWKAAAGTDTRYTLAQVKAGSLDKAFATTEVHEDNDGVLMVNVSETPGADIEEVA